MKLLQRIPFFFFSYFHKSAYSLIFPCSIWGRKRD